MHKDSNGRFKELVAKVVMGGGKSKVFSPILAYQKANGENLVLMEVPKALLRTNFTDLKAMSNDLFGQTAVLFEFSRDSDCSPKALEGLFRLFSDVMVNKKYIVTTGESLQSLELKYFELLSSIPDSNDTQKMNQWSQQVYWIEQLVLFLRNRGDCIIDEVHQGLLLKNRLNYTIGESRRIPGFITNEVVALYQFLNYVSLEGIEEITEPGLTMASLLHSYKPLKTKQHYEQACQKLIDELLLNMQSPLLAAFKRSRVKFGKDEKALLKAYVLDQVEEIPNFIFNLPEDLQDIIALYKEQTTHLLPFTLRRNANEHYGPSKNPKKTSAQQAVSIPYRANNKPNERSNFGNEIESINYTIQSMLINGVSEALLNQYLLIILQQAKAEAEDKQLDSINGTAPGHLFKQMSKGLLLSELDLDNPDQIHRLHLSMAQNQSLIYEVLKTLVLPNIRMNPKVLSSNALNHVDMLHTVQGYSGTPWNASTYHHRLKYERALATGTDGFIISCLQRKHTPVKTIDFSQPEGLVKAILEQYQAGDQLKAIIDISAAFKGISNEVVARQISETIEKNPERFRHPEPIKFVLFFNEHDQLCALPVENMGQSNKIIIIGSSSPEVIAEKLGCSPNARFTYYDQSHMLGADIRQGEKAKAAVLCDQNTGISSFLQGALRMRDVLDGGQSVDVFVPVEMKHKQSLDKLCPFMKRKDKDQLRQDNYIAACYKMSNYVRDDLLKRLLNFPGTAEEKAALFTQFENQFIDQQPTRLFHRFGGIAKMKSTRTLLEQQQKALLDNWRQVLASTEMDIVSADEESLANNMVKVIEKTCQPGICDEKQLSPGKVEAVEVELFTEVETEKERLAEAFDPSRSAVSYIPWCFPDNPSLYTLSLQEIIKSASPAFTPDFSDNILASSNFYKIYVGQRNYITQTMLPVHGIYFLKEEGALRCYLLSPEELTEAKRYVENRPEKMHWISTTCHTVLAGNMPETIKQDKQYQTLMEQIRFFAGDLGLLIDRDMPVDWLSNETAKNLEFFENHLAPGRECDLSHLKQLQMGLMTLGKMMKFLSANPERDLTRHDWKAHFPSAESSEVNEIRNMAKAYHDLTGAWWHDDLSIEALANLYNLSPLAQGYLSQYQQAQKESVYLRKLKRLILTLGNQSESGCKLSIDTIATLVNDLFSGSKSAAKSLVENFDDDTLIPIEKWDNNAVKSVLALYPDRWVSPDPGRILAAVIANSSYFSGLDKKRLLDICRLKNLNSEFIDKLLTHPLADNELILTLCQYHELTDENLHKILSNETITPLLTPESYGKLASQPNLSSADAMIIGKYAMKVNGKILLSLLDHFKHDNHWLASVFDIEGIDEVLVPLCNSEANRKIILSAITLLLREESLSSHKIQRISNYPDLDLTCQLAIMLHANTPQDIRNSWVSQEKDTACIELLVSSIIHNNDHLFTSALLNNPGLKNEQVLKLVKSGALSSSETQEVLLSDRVSEPILSALIENANTEQEIEALLINTKRIKLSEGILKAIVLNDLAGSRTLEILEQIDLSKARKVKLHLACYGQYQKLEAELSALKTLASEASQSPDLTLPAKEAALSLYEDLSQAAKTLIDKNEGLIDRKRVDAFKKRCESIFCDDHNKRVNLLKKHPHWWYRISPILRKILGIISAIIVIPALVAAITSKNGYKGVFFGTAETEGSKKLGKVQESIKNLDISLK